MSVFIEGIGIAEYRSFGSDIQHIGSFRKINLFIGQNNSGKSNILRFLSDHYTTLVKLARPNGRGNVEFTDLDRHLGSTSGRTKFSLAIRPEGAKLETLLEPYQEKLTPERKQWIANILSSQSIFSIFRGECVALTKNSPLRPGAPGQCDGLAPVY